MNLRNLIIMLVCMIAMGGFWYFHDVKGGASREEAKALEERVFPDLEASSITKLQWTGGQADPTASRVFKKVADHWVIEMDKDLCVRASSDELGNLLDQIARLNRVTVVNEAAPKAALAQFGLEKPAHVLEVWATKKGDKITDAAATDKAPKDSLVHVTLKLGNNTPDESNLYVLTDSGNVLEVNAPFVQSLDRPLNELREKALLAINPANVVALSLACGEDKQAVPHPTIVMNSQKETKAEESAQTPTPSDSPDSEQQEEADEELWDLTKPVVGPADSGKVKDFLWALRSLEIQSFLHPEDSASFGTVRERIELTASNAKESIVLEIGQNVKGKADEVYVRRSNPTEICVAKIDNIQSPFWVKTLADFEDHHLARFKVDDINRVVVKLPAEKAQNNAPVACIEASRIRDGWDVVRPSVVTRDEAVRNQTVSELLYSIADVQWETKAVGTSSNPIKPVTEITLYGKDNKVIATVGFTAADAQGAVTAQISGQTEVYTIREDPTVAWKQAYSKLDGQVVQNPQPPAATGTPVLPSPHLFTPTPGIPQAPTQTGTPQPK